MTKRPLIILGLILLLVFLAGAGTVAVFLVYRNRASADRLVGTWEGQGQERTRMQGTIAEGKIDAPLNLQISAKATFHKDGTLDWSFRAAEPGFKFSYQFPDPSKPGDVARWEVIRSDWNGMVVRLMGPDGPEYNMSFRGAADFSMTPTDPTKGTGTIIFRRVPLLK
jgi:hypothetical protein